VRSLHPRLAALTEQQGWNDDALLQILLAYVITRGLEDDVFAHAETVAEMESEGIPDLNPQPMSALDHVVADSGLPAAEWTSIDGPETGVGAEYWYRHEPTGKTAYVCIDQGECTALRIHNEGA